MWQFFTFHVGKESSPMDPMGFPRIWDSILPQKKKIPNFAGPKNWEAKSYGLRMAFAMVTIGLVYVTWHGWFFVLLTQPLANL